MNPIVKFKFIESFLEKNKTIRRSDLMNTFEIGPAQATRFFRDYMKKYPNQIEFDTKIKSYVACKKFKKPALKDQNFLDFLAAIDTVFNSHKAKS
jgi:hypothetical protein